MAYNRPMSLDYEAVRGGAARPPWRAELSRRFHAHLPLKALAITGAISLFMAIYFLLLRHPLFPITVIPLTSLDRLIGFEPWSLLPYASLWVYISIAPLLLDTRRTGMLYLASAVLLATAGFLIFLFWPSTVPAPGIDWSRYPYIAFLKSIDAAGNACPSLHVAYAVSGALWLRYVLKTVRTPGSWQALNLIWCGVIAYSTLATKQHVAIDLAAGALLGVLATAPFLWLARLPSP